MKSQPHFVIFKTELAELGDELIWCSIPSDFSRISGAGEVDLKQVYRHTEAKPSLTLAGFQLSRWGDLERALER